MASEKVEIEKSVLMEILAKLSSLEQELQSIKSNPSPSPKFYASELLAKKESRELSDSQELAKKVEECVNLILTEMKVHPPKRFV